MGRTTLYFMYNKLNTVSNLFSGTKSANKKNNTRKQSHQINIFSPCLFFLKNNKALLVSLTSNCHSFVFLYRFLASTRAFSPFIQSNNIEKNTKKCQSNSPFLPLSLSF